MSKLSQTLITISNSSNTFFCCTTSSKTFVYHHSYKKMQQIIIFWQEAETSRWHFLHEKLLKQMINYHHSVFGGGRGGGLCIVYILCKVGPKNESNCLLGFFGLGLHASLVTVLNPPKNLIQHRLPSYLIVWQICGFKYFWGQTERWSCVLYFWSMTLVRSLL